MSVTTELRDMLDAHGIEVTVHKPMTKAELARENRELRELVRDMCKAIVFPYAVVNPAVLVKRARELGIEVGE